MYAKYDKELLITYDSDTDLKNQKFYYNSQKDLVVNKLIPGDDLLIYSNNSDVQHVFVEKAEVVEIEISFGVARGSKEIEIYTEVSGIVINDSKIEYIITDNDKAFCEIDEHTSYSKFYGTYNPANNTETTEFTTLIILDAVYSFKPR